MAVVIREILVHLLLAALLGAGIGWALRGLRSRRLHADAAAASRRTLEELKARLNVSESARESAVAELQSSAEAARRQLVALQRDVQEMQAARDAALSETKGARTEVSRLALQLEATATARTAAQEELDAARAALGEAQTRLAAVEAEAKAAPEDSDTSAASASHDEAVQQRLDTMRATLRAAEGGWDTARAQAEAALQQLAAARRQLTESDGERDVVAARLADVQGQLAVVLAQRDAAAPLLPESSTPTPPPSPTVPQPVRDDLQRIRGIGPVLERTLHRAGVYCYAQIATWTPEDIRLMSARLPGVQKRIVRDRWATAARRLHLEKYGSAPERSS